MLINRVANQLLIMRDLRELLQNLSDGKDATVAVAQSARPLLSAALWAHDPRPCLIVVPGEEAADRMAERIFGAVVPKRHLVKLTHIGELLHRVLLRVRGEDHQLRLHAFNCLLHGESAAVHSPRVRSEPKHG